ncbi:MAG: hypothetical protein WKG07_12755 [Hymenobacter sp.]
MQRLPAKAGPRNRAGATGFRPNFAALPPPMLFNSLHFLVFFPVVLGLYFGLPARWRGPLLLAASYYFYLSWKPAYGLLLAGTTLLDYFSGVRMGRLATQRQRRPWLYLSLASNLGTLFIFKYFNFFVATAGELAAAVAPAVCRTRASAGPAGGRVVLHVSVGSLRRGCVPGQAARRAALGAVCAVRGFLAAAGGWPY